MIARVLSAAAIAIISAFAQTPQSCNPAITYIGPAPPTPPMICPGVTAVSDASPWTWKGTITFPAASGSTQTNFTAAFTASDVKLKTAANGGAIRNTVTRVGVTVPADFVLTSDSTCATIAGSYTWGFEDYSATAGTLTGWVMIPSFSSSASTVIYACAGNSLITTYQGGAVGAEFDSNVIRAYHMGDSAASTTVMDASGVQNGTAQHNTSTVSTTGKIGNALALSAIDYVGIGSVFVPSGTSAWTLSGWVKATNSVTANANSIFGMRRSANGAPTLDFQIGNDGIDNLGVAKLSLLVRDDAGVGLAHIHGATTLSLNTWYYVVATRDSSKNLTMYLNGSVDASGSDTMGTSINLADSYIAHEVQNPSIPALEGIGDELRVTFTDRSANWIASEYANQSAPPALSALVTP